MRRPKASVRKANVGKRIGSGWSCLSNCVDDDQDGREIK